MERIKEWDTYVLYLLKKYYSKGFTLHEYMFGLFSTEKESVESVIEEINKMKEINEIKEIKGSMTDFDKLINKKLNYLNYLNPELLKRFRSKDQDPNIVGYLIDIYFKPLITFIFQWEGMSITNHEIQTTFKEVAKKIAKFLSTENRVYENKQKKDFLKEFERENSYSLSDIRHSAFEFPEEFTKNPDPFVGISKECLFNELAYKDDYVCFYHGQAFVSLIFQELYKILNNDKLIHLRTPFSTKEISEFGTIDKILNYMETEKTLREWYDRLQKEKEHLLAVNVTLFGNSMMDGECSFSYFMKNNQQWREYP